MPGEKDTKRTVNVLLDSISSFKNIYIMYAFLTAESTQTLLLVSFLHSYTYKVAQQHVSHTCVVLLITVLM